MKQLRKKSYSYDNFGDQNKNLAEDINKPTA